MNDFHSYTRNIFRNDSYTVGKSHLETAWEQALRRGGSRLRRARPHSALPSAATTPSGPTRVCPRSLLRGAWSQSPTPPAAARGPGSAPGRSCRQAELASACGPRCSPGRTARPLCPSRLALDSPQPGAPHRRRGVSAIRFAPNWTSGR